VPAFQPQKRKKTYHEVDLRLDDPRIDRDAKVLESLRNLVRAGVRRRFRIDPSKSQPSLYPRYRGNGFPLWKVHGTRLSRWKDLTPWMKVQIATLVLSESDWVFMRVHVHDDVVDHLASKGEDLKTYLRDRINRRLELSFGKDKPGFFFVVEDQDVDGNPVRPHAHGAIAIRSLDVSLAPPKSRGALTKRARTGNRKVVEKLVGRMVIKDHLRAASGRTQHPTVASSGVNQLRNVWMQDPRVSLFHNDWVTYAFKNVRQFSPVLGEGGMAISHSLNREARFLWGIIRKGDDFLS